MRKYMLTVSGAIVLAVSVSTSAFASQPQDTGMGIFSAEVRTTVQAIKDQVKKENPNLDDGEVLTSVAKKIETVLKNKNKHLVGTDSYSDDFLALIGKQLGPTEAAVCDSNPFFCGYILADAQLAWDSAASTYTDLHNGKGDAYRHGLWQGLSAFHTTKDYSKRFGDAHETDFPGPTIEYQMDIYNNSVGRDIGASKWVVWSVYDGMKEGITNGNFKYIKNGVLTATNR